MRKESFKDLEASLKEAIRIKPGKLEPARITPFQTSGKQTVRSKKSTRKP